MPLFSNIHKILFRYKDEKSLIKLYPETSGDQVKLSTSENIHGKNVQDEFEYLYKTMVALITANDAMVFKGVLNSEDEIPHNYKIGWTWKIGTDGKYKGYNCHIGDLLMAKYNYTSKDANDEHDFVVLYSNQDGDVIVTGSHTAGNIVMFDNDNGRFVTDSGITSAELKQDWIKLVPILADFRISTLHDNGILIVGG